MELLLTILSNAIFYCYFMNIAAFCMA